MNQLNLSSGRPRVTGLAISWGAPARARASESPVHGCWRAALPFLLLGSLWAGPVGWGPALEQVVAGLLCAFPALDGSYTRVFPRASWR